MKNKISKIVMMMLVGMFFSTAHAAGDFWSTDVTTLTNENPYESTSCGGVTVYCNYTTCMDPAVFPAIPSTTQTTILAGTAEAQAAAPNGGWVYEALGTGACDGANWECIRNSTDYANHIYTVCTGEGTSTTATGVINTTTNCVSGYTNCDANSSDCEIQIGSNYVEPNTRYTASCIGECKPGFLDCSAAASPNTAGSDLNAGGNGCETTANTTDSDGFDGLPRVNTHFGGTCTTFVCDAGYFERVTGDADTVGCLGVVGESCTVTASGLPGSCTGTGTSGTAATGTCACEALDVPEFAGGGHVDADGVYTNAPVTWSNDTALIRGDQLGTGAYIQFGDDADANDLLEGSEIEFEIDGSGKITAGYIGQAYLGTDPLNDGKILSVNATGEAVWVDPGALSATGDNLGDHTATEDLIMGVNSIVGSAGDVNGISIDSTGDTGNVTIDGSLTVAGITFPTTDGTVGQIMTTDGAGNISWIDNNVDAVTVGADGTCADGQLLQYDLATTQWTCVDASSISGAAQTLDDAYNAGTDAATRTVEVDADSVAFHAPAGALSNVFEIVNEGDAAAIKISDGTNTLFAVDADGATVVKELRLVASDAGVDGKPTATCDSTTIGDIAYALDGTNNIGFYYGCKQLDATTYAWVSLEVFGSL